MNSKKIWTNYKIYAFLIGVVLGTLVYNLIGIDFSFSMIDSIKPRNFFDSYIYMLVGNIKFYIILLVLSLLKQKKQILFIVILIESFILAGAVTLSAILRILFLLSGFIHSLTRIIMANCILEKELRLKGKIFAAIIMVIGTLVENFFVFYF